MKKGGGWGRNRQIFPPLRHSKEKKKNVAKKKIAPIWKFAQMATAPLEKKIATLPFMSRRLGEKSLQAWQHRSLVVVEVE